MSPPRVIAAAWPNPRLQRTRSATLAAEPQAVRPMQTAEGYLPAFDGAVADIASAYDRLGLQLGWRFLYGPPSSLLCPNGVMLVGINPGETFSVRASVEPGNAYLVEHWSRDGTNLQAQVLQLFEVFARYIGRGRSGRELLDETLTTNFCPFRSPTWAQLSRKREAVNFSRQFWANLVPRINARLIISMGRLPFRQFQRVLTTFASGPAVRELPTGWGKLTFCLQTYSHGTRKIVLARIPHLSRYRLMSRPACLPFVGAFAQTIQLQAVFSS